jgi:hypothetical protein
MGFFGGTYGSKGSSVVSDELDRVVVTATSTGLLAAEYLTWYDSCVNDWIYGTSPRGIPWTYGFRHVPVNEQKRCAKVNRLLEATKHSQKHLETFTRIMVDDCLVETHVAYPGCIEWMPDACLLEDGTFQDSCYEHAELNQDCVLSLEATGCWDDTITIMNNVAGGVASADAYGQLKEYSDKAFSDAIKYSERVVGDAIHEMDEKCGDDDAPWTRLCIALAHKMKSSQEQLLYRHVDDTCPRGIKPTECYSYVQRHTGGVPAWAPYVAVGAAAAFIAAPVVAGVVAKYSAGCIHAATACVIGWKMGQKQLVTSSITTKAKLAAAKGVSTATGGTTVSNSNIAKEAYELRDVMPSEWMWQAGSLEWAEAASHVLASAGR